MWCPRRSWDTEAGVLSLLAVRPSVPGRGASLLGVQHSREAGRQVPVKPLVNCGHSTSWWEFGPILTMAQLFFMLFSATESSFTSDCMHQLFRHVETFFSGADDPFSGLNKLDMSLLPTPSFFGSSLCEITAFYKPQFCMSGF